MLTRKTLYLAAEAVSRQCRDACEAGDIDRLIDHADALKAIKAEIDDQQFYLADELSRSVPNVEPIVRIDGRGVS